MYRKREAKIADAIRTDSSSNKIFSYVVLFVISLVVIVVGYILAGLVTTLSVHTEKIVLNIDSMSSSMKAIEQNMDSMTKYIHSMDTSTKEMSVDVNKMTDTISSMSKNIEHMDTSTKDMKSDMHDISKLNPLRLF